MALLVYLMLCLNFYGFLLDKPQVWMFWKVGASFLITMQVNILQKHAFIWAFIDT